MHNVSNLIPILAKDGAAALLTDEAKGLSVKVTEFSERSEHWTQLANLACLYEDGRQVEFLTHASECLVGYGWRKDLWAMDVLDAVLELSSKDQVVARARLDTLVPIIEEITEFTDGDETNHLRTDLIEVVSKVAPDCLNSLYEHHLSVDEHHYADKCLIEHAKVMDLESPEGAALARTFLDERTLGVLEDRALNDPAACALLDAQNAFLGRKSKVRNTIKVPEEDLSKQEEQITKADPSSFGYEDFVGVVAAANVDYKSRKEFMVEWLHHWKRQGKASHALQALRSYFEKSQTAYGADEILDEVFLLSLSVEGKDAAYPWLVKAQIHRHGWQSFYTSESEIMQRISLAAMHYSDRWFQFIKDTSEPAPYYRRRRYSFVIGYQYLVRFLMLVGQVEVADKITTRMVDTLVEEVREQPIPEGSWFRSNSYSPELCFLFQRLKWPVPMARWRTAKQICNLLSDPDTRSSTTVMLLQNLDECRTESEVCEILTIVFLTSPEARPTSTALKSRIHCPSILADIILERTYGMGQGIGGWNQAHSGEAPDDFEGSSYFEEHKTAHVPPIFISKIREMERISFYPFLQHWAYEWKTLRDKLGTHYTRYPSYFDDVSQTRSGIIGQYWQRMREVYLSAYLRTLAYAVDSLGMPQWMADEYSLNIVHGIAGLFNVEPSTRPVWLSDYPERFCAVDADLALLIRELLHVARTDGMRMISLDTPIASSVQKFANLTISAHLVTSDYELPDGAFLYEKMPPLSVADTFELKGPLAEITVEEARTEGITGDEVSACTQLFPIPFGTWQSEYLAMGLRIPASYTVPGVEIQCTRDGIECIAADAKVTSRTQIWNDDWTPQYPKGGSTRCGTATMIDEKVLTESKEKLGRKLAFFVELRIWERENEYGDYFESKRNFFLLDTE